MKKHMVFFVVITFLCACVGQETFTLTDITFCANEPADRSYDQKLDPTYQQGETVWIYLEAFRFDYREEDQSYVAYFDTVFEVYDEKGNCIHQGIQQMEIPSRSTPVYVWFTFFIESEYLEEGIYTVRITVTDTLSGQTATAEGTFYIVK